MVFREHMHEQPHGGGFITSHEGSKGAPSLMVSRAIIEAEEKDFRSFSEVGPPMAF